MASEKAESRTPGAAGATREFTIIAQDPSVRRAGRILTARVSVPAEDLGAGPRGYRVHVIDYDASSNRLIKPLPSGRMRDKKGPRDPFQDLTDSHRSAASLNAALLQNPQFHAQNVYAIVMRTLAYFERALGRRVSWSFGSHQLKVAPHAFAEPNAFYSNTDEGLLFGYFAGPDGLVFTCLSHDIVVHETVHAIVDGLRPRLMEPSSPDQAAFHEAFADVVALLSVFSVQEVVFEAIRQASKPRKGKTRRAWKGQLLNVAKLTIEALQQGILFGLGEQFGDVLSGVHGSSLRRSASLPPNRRLLEQPEYQEEHRRGEILVAAMLRAFLRVFRTRLESLGRDSRGKLPAMRIAEEGSDIAGRLLTLTIRALDYLPPTDLEFGDFLSALITSDLEIRPDDSRYQIRNALRSAFEEFGIKPTSAYDAGGEPGRWEPPELEARRRKGKNRLSALSYAVVHREALQRDTDEVFKFLWENRRALGLCESAYTTVAAVRPCLRVDEDGFTLRETVADYVQILTVRAGELEAIPIPGRKGHVRKPAGLSEGASVRLLGGGAVIFDEFGKLKYHIRNALLHPRKQTRRLQHLYDAGSFNPQTRMRGFDALHLKGMQPELPALTPEPDRWL